MIFYAEYFGSSVLKQFQFFSLFCLVLSLWFVFFISLPLCFFASLCIFSFPQSPPVSSGLLLCQIVVLISHHRSTSCLLTHTHTHPHSHHHSVSAQRFTRFIYMTEMRSSGAAAVDAQKRLKQTQMVCLCVTVMPQQRLLQVCCSCLCVSMHADPNISFPVSLTSSVSRVQRRVSFC